MTVHICCRKGEQFLPFSLMEYQCSLSFAVFFCRPLFRQSTIEIVSPVWNSLPFYAAVCVCLPAHPRPPSRLVADKEALSQMYFPHWDCVCFQFNYSQPHTLCLLTLNFLINARQLYTDKTFSLLLCVSLSIPFAFVLSNFFRSFTFSRA